MSEIFTSTVEKDDGHGVLRTDVIRLTEIGGGIAHTLTCRDGALCVQHCNLVIEVEKLEDIKQLGKLEEGSSQRRIVYDDETLSPTLQAAMGAGGGNVPLVKKIKIRQATKQGFIECEVGGMLSGISNKHFTTRKNNRERSDQPDNNDGECP